MKNMLSSFFFFEWVLDGKGLGPTKYVKKCQCATNDFYDNIFDWFVVYQVIYSLHCHIDLNPYDF